MVRKVFTVLGVVVVFAVMFSPDFDGSVSRAAGTARAAAREGVSSIVGQEWPVSVADSDVTMMARATTRSEMAPSGRRNKRRTGADEERQVREVVPVAEMSSAYKGTLSGPVSNVLLKGLPEPGIQEAPQDTSALGNQHVSNRPTLLEKRQMEAVLAPGESLGSVGTSPGNPQSRFSFLEIEVQHHAHTFRLLGNLPSGQKEVLYECMVGLGNPSEFPTPVGVYYVTHIYDDNPWWIPPRDRAWAAGQSPSRKVYGGIMAPLLKKRPVRSKQKFVDAEDKIEGEMKLCDDGYRFHGTNAPRSIGQNQSHGCVRMLPDDVKKVAALIKDYVGYTDRREAENGTFVMLTSPVRLNLVK